MFHLLIVLFRASPRQLEAGSTNRTPLEGTMTLGGLAPTRL